mmetsp:Transcript_21700/g.55418  ORF Transcript_21700/g.55418 Transcript_21700/m.55418 type:complete len:200 (-) Transcript_21700:638-1237(-)
MSRVVGRDGYGLTSFSSHNLEPEKATLFGIFSVASFGGGCASPRILPPRTASLSKCVLALCLTAPPTRRVLGRDGPTHGASSDSQRLLVPASRQCEVMQGQDRRDGHVGGEEYASVARSWRRRSVRCHPQSLRAQQCISPILQAGGANLAFPQDFRSEGCHRASKKTRNPAARVHHWLGCACDVGGDCAGGGSSLHRKV